MGKIAGLKPCPFCGGGACLEWNVSSKWGYFVFVRCEECRAQTRIIQAQSELFEPAGFSRTDEFWESRPFEKAAELWNQRKRRRKEVQK